MNGAWQVPNKFYKRYVKDGLVNKLTYIQILPVLFQHEIAKQNKTQKSQWLNNTLSSPGRNHRMLT